MPKKWYDSKVVKIQDESPTTKRFWIEVEEPIEFKAGQFVTMDLPIHEKRLKRWRSYSIANPPDKTNLLEFCIVYLEGGLASEYFFKEVQINTPIKFKGPAGVFTLPEKIEKDLILICTGTGVAPFRSMILDILHERKIHQNIHLIFGTRFSNGILYQKEFEKLEKEMPNFKYSIALSREEPLPLLNGTTVKKGYIHQIYLEDYRDNRIDVDFYICGWKNMVDEAVDNLINELGYDKSQVHYELYG